MELLLMVSVSLCGSVLAKPMDGRWIFPDELDALTKKPNRFDFFQPKSVTSPLPGRGPTGRAIGDTTPKTTEATSTTGVTAPQPSVLFLIPNCNCKFLPQYNPVCGTNGRSYVNAQMVKCVRRCGKNVAVARMGTCQGRFLTNR